MTGRDGHAWGHATVTEHASDAKCVGGAEALSSPPLLPSMLSSPLPSSSPPPAPSLTERVRALYENSIVPVREIARLAGVTERTIYKYARKEGWVPRVTRLSRDGTAAGLAARGVGGRFVPLAEEGRPHARGLKALDPAGAERAAAACVRAGALSDQAIAQAEADAQRRAARVRAERAADEHVRTLEVLTGAFVDLMRFAAEQPELHARAERLVVRLGNAILCQIEELGPSAAPVQLPAPRIATA